MCSAIYYISRSGSRFVGKCFSLNERFSNREAHWEPYPAVAGWSVSFQVRAHVIRDIAPLPSPVTDVEGIILFQIGTHAFRDLQRLSTAVAVSVA